MVTAPLFLIAAVAFLLSDTNTIHVNSDLVWAFVLIGAGVAFLLEWRYAKRIASSFEDLRWSVGESTDSFALMRLMGHSRKTARGNAVGRLGKAAADCQSAWSRSHQTAAEASRRAIYSSVAGPLETAVAARRL